MTQLSGKQVLCHVRRSLTDVMLMCCLNTTVGDLSGWIVNWLVTAQMLNI